MGVLDALNPERNPYLVIHSDVLALIGFDRPVEHSMAAFEEYAKTRDATIFFPTFSPAVCGSGFFSVLETPCSTGEINQQALKLKDAVRSRHPIDSYAAIGKDKSVVECFYGAPLHGKGSASEFFKNADARFILWGAPPSKVTLIHHYELARKPSYRYLKTFKGTWQDRAGKNSAYEFDFPVKKTFLTGSYDFDHLDADLLAHVPYLSVKAREVPFYSVRASELGPYLSAKLAEDEYYVLNDAAQVRRKMNETRFSFLGSENYDLVRQIFSETAKQFGVEGFSCEQLPFDVYRQDLLSDLPALYEKGINVGVFCERIEALLRCDFTELQKDDSLEQRIQNAVQEYLKYARLYVSKTGGQAYVCNFISFEDEAYRFIGQEHSIAARICGIANECLRVEAAKHDNLTVLNLASVAARIGKNQAVDKKLFFMGRIPFSLSLSKQLVFEVIGSVLERQGKTIRGLILDLDNTLWGGIVGEDGKDRLQLGGEFPGNTFVYFQRRLKELHSRGIFLALCSKNSPELALDAINTHPHMVLKEADFSSIRINWSHKTDNIREIMNELSLGPANLAFIDDSPLEREEAKRLLPGLLVPAFTGEVCELADFLVENPYFYASVVTKEDLKRIDNFRTHQAVSALRTSGADLTEFYRSLRMRVSLVPMNDGNRARILSLIHKTNQFNATTKRYSEAEIARLLHDKGQIRSIRYQDKLMPEPEDIGVVVALPGVSRLVIDTFLMSCRFLNRTIETKVIADLAELAIQGGFMELQGLYIPSERNSIVGDLYTRHGFQASGKNEFTLSLLAGAPAAPGWFNGADNE